MASSRLTEDGRCIVTTPCSWCEVGHVLYPMGSAATYGIAPADWVTRLLGGYVTKEKCWELDTRAAFDALIDVLAGRSARPRRCANNAP
jgi:hypothetical protein